MARYMYSPTRCCINHLPLHGIGLETIFACLLRGAVSSSGLLLRSLPIQETHAACETLGSVSRVPPDGVQGAGRRADMQGGGRSWRDTQQELEGKRFGLLCLGRPHGMGSLVTLWFQYSINLWGGRD